MSQQDTSKKPGAGEIIAGALFGGIPKLFGYESVTPLDLILRKGDEERKGGTSAGMDKPTMRRGGSVKKMAKGGSASSRADGCARKGKTRGKIV